MSLILASSSPRRKKILRELGYRFQSISPDIDESNVNNLKPIDYVLNISERKASHVWNNHKESCVLAGDTIVDFNNQIIGKPSSNSEAFTIIDKLSNQTHSVISGLSLFFEGKVMNIFDKTDVTFKKLSKSTIENYIKSFDVLDKAGAYNIEDAENILIKHIDGCYNNIVGFPLKKFEMSKIKKILDSL
ncbi:MAG: septum formation protein Maf [Candidatus Marinimicrobia bacterium]|jgi:septum formation protein|nr:septum formation protein Maf [Gammaproteobacteria bacterium]MBL6911513.1 septum formation protein Maf [Candidatus Neomarinimicrobiota bacterium]MBT3728400.1 septum formation protein Maf [Candidatus Neomarinimicrobiota bacterium]MBT3944040.1 septum formation protein Maf [Candidatus Neomarinimicrobiota bacterium]MBT4111764.1 septum formation protein Maf [Candidatus Neomarinimicrobiota bacterium]